MKESHGRFYRLTTTTTRILVGLLRGMRVEGRSHVPASGPCLIVCNHLSWLDPMVLAAAAPDRQIHYMAKAELFDRRILGTLVRTLGAFPVERGHMDRKALRTAFELLGKGRIVGLFPEGTRGPAPHSTEQVMQPWHGGAGLIALKAGVDVIPAAMLHTRGLLEDRGKDDKPLRIRFGPPLETTGHGGGRERLLEIQEASEKAVRQLLVDLLKEEAVGSV